MAKFRKKKVLHWGAIILSPIIVASVAYYCTIFISSGNKLLIDSSNQLWILGLIMAILVVICSNASLTMFSIKLQKRLNLVVEDLNTLTELILSTNLKNHDELLQIVSKGDKYE